MKPLTRDDVRGIIPPLVTPFAEDETIDLAAFRSELQHMHEIGIEVVAIGGSTGDGEVLARAELAALCQVAATESSLGVIAGVISTNTRDALTRAEAACEAGASALMVTPPIYHQTSPENLLSFYSDIADRVRLPIIVYNILTHAPIAPDTINRLADVDGVIAIKESSGGSLESLDVLLDTVQDRIAVIWAIDSLLFEGFALGAAGSIAAINTMYPTECVELFDAIQHDDVGAAREVHRTLAPLMRLTDVPEDWPARVKLVLRLQGRQVGHPRRPYTALPAAIQQAIGDAVGSIRSLRPAAAT